MLCFKKIHIIITSLLITSSSLIGMEDRFSDQTTIKQFDQENFNFPLIHPIPQQLKNLPEAFMRYVNQLPRITMDNGSIEIESTITEFICKFSNSHNPITGKEVPIEKIRRNINQGSPISFMLLGFPIKSPNSDSKVIAPSLDMAELCALLTLNHIAKEIETVYSPGAQIKLCTREPFIFDFNNAAKKGGGIELFSEKKVEKYQKQLKSLVNYFFPTLQIDNISNIRQLYNEKYAHEPAAINKSDKANYSVFMQEEIRYEAFLDSLRTEVLANNDMVRASVNKKFKEAQGHNFMSMKQHFDLSTIEKIKKLIPINAEIKKIAEALSVHAALGAIRMRKLIEENYATENYIRLSIHPSKDGDVSQKLGINLIPGSTLTPWHAAAVVTREGMITLKHTKQVKKKTVKHYTTAHNLNLAYLEENL